MLCATSDNGGKWITEGMGLNTLFCTGSSFINKHRLTSGFYLKVINIPIYIKLTIEKEA